MAATQETRVIWKGDMGFESISGKGARVLMDAAPDVGGHDEGFAPMELLLVALAGCTAMDVISILKKKRQDVVDFQVVARGERADEHPRVYTEIDIEFAVRGHDVDPKAVERAVELSATKYCSISQMLSKTAKLTTHYQVEEVP